MLLVQKQWENEICILHWISEPSYTVACHNMCGCDTLLLLNFSFVNALCVGIPPFAHGSLDVGLDLELQFIQAGIHLLVEKPVSVQPPEKLRAYVEAVMQAQKRNNVIVGVAYMFRYHPAVEKIKEVSVKHALISY